MSKTLTTGDVFNVLEAWAPKELAYDWDPIGLQVGSYQEPVKKMLITLDVDDRVVDEAIEQGANLIIAHHPFLFHPLPAIDVHSTKGALVAKLIKHQITVYAAHTNLDIADGGVNDMIAARLGIEDTSVLVETDRERLMKVVVFVPNDHVAAVEQAIGDAGAGHIGAYSHCSFKTPGEGTFKPLAGAKPFIGEIDTLTDVEETRIETIVPERLLAGTIQAIKQTHPYEEIVYDVLEAVEKGEAIGLGRIGSWTEEPTVEHVIEKVKEAFTLSHVRTAGPAEKEVRRIALVGGSGEKYMRQAKQKGADVYITGDVTFHQAQEAEQMGLTVIDAGHYIEHVMMEETVRFFQTNELTSMIECTSSTVNTNPFSYR